MRSIDRARRRPYTPRPMQSSSTRPGDPWRMSWRACSRSSGRGRSVRLQEPRELRPILIVVRRRWIQFPPVRVALDDFLAALQFFVVLILNAERTPDVVDDLRVGGRVVA